MLNLVNDVKFLNTRQSRLDGQYCQSCRNLGTPLRAKTLEKKSINWR